jgi:chromate transporter
MEGEADHQDIGILELVFYYLRLGALGFGGPVALCGQMERELVQERKWLSREEMRDGIAVCQSLPSPLAIQVGIFVSYLRGGLGSVGRRLGVHPTNFIIVSALGALYVRLSGLPVLTAIFYGVSPAVIALIVHSCYRLAKLGMEDWLQWAIAAACFLVTVALRAEVAALFIASGLVGILYYGSFFRRRAAVPSTTAVVTVGAGIKLNSAPILGKLLFFFLKAADLRKRPRNSAFPGERTGSEHVIGTILRAVDLPRQN